MASSVLVELVDNDGDDDGFDWEAAVKEIDIACEANKPSTYCFPSDSHSLVDNGSKDKKWSISGQSTLDNFVSKIHSGRVSENRFDRDSGQDDTNTETNLGVSSLDIDVEAATTWIYPVNIPLRDYQLAITRTALFSNTLVALPTGLGKTFIAAVVMYNYFRWFPEGKIVFAAPSRPLVLQQIQACHNIVGIPQEWTVDLTGQTTPSRRAYLWNAKRVFFVTPQVLEKDIQSGKCIVKYLVCLVIDEAHRAQGNYSYCVALRELMSVPVQLRVLALSATPGSKQQTIQHVIDNLHISALEYRNENDHDVSPYVHNRKLELVTVAMGHDAVEISALLLEVLRPFMARLSAYGVLRNKDSQNFSPCGLVRSRSKFREAPPVHISLMKCREVEGYYGVVITLYSIHTLLSSHGIRPAYEILEENWRKGTFARHMCRNEGINKVKFLMQQSISHGVLMPKLSKMLEILIDHFRKSDPQSSRVIIFSSYRGSVSDIMETLLKIGDYVKAAKFIGQGSGKTFKGQSQKDQQEVLEKFRAGAYNVLVATSIGEEGLDIMEVDLVVCFDANVSNLRMTQRMGRTGRKHDGRVVVLACEGSEFKGYMRKQARSKAMKKHMRNGGMSSFNFHPSPRMVPHVIRPEVQFVHITVTQFVPRVKKVKDDHRMKAQLFRENLNEEEIKLISRYFLPREGMTWKPSLIAFPHFQAFPSNVQTVLHSSRTELLVDFMQHLQGLSFSNNGRTFSEDEGLPGQYVKDDTGEQSKSRRKDSVCPNQPRKVQCMVDELDSVPETQETVQKNTPIVFCNEVQDFDLSPRLTNFIKSGFVPESPISDENGFLNDKGKHALYASDPVSSAKLHLDLRSPKKNEKESDKITACSPVNNEICTPVMENSAYPSACLSASSVEEGKTSTARLTNNSCREDWQLSHGDTPGSIVRVHKLKRLRRYGDPDLRRNKRNMKEKSVSTTANLVRSSGTTSPVLEMENDGRKIRIDARMFIEEEAEVSSDAKMYSDDEDDEICESYDSFIDDGTAPTATGTQAEAGKIDMMAIYRRSLLSQSPMEWQANFTRRVPETESPSRKTINSLQTPNGSENLSILKTSESHSVKSYHNKISSEARAHTNGPSGIRKRKSNSHPHRTNLAVNLESRFVAEIAGSEPCVPGPAEGAGTGADVFPDDEFYASLDLDEVEAQAAMFLSMQGREGTVGQMVSPSFDLGI